MVSFTPLQELSRALSTVVAVVAPSMVSVYAHHSRASGFVWRPGLVVTAEEALPEDGDLSVTVPGGETVAARLAGRDPSTDIPLLRIERADLPAAPLHQEPPPLGAVAVVVGAEEGDATAAFGLVSRSGPAWRSMRGGDIAARLELAAAPRRHAEGGLVLDAGGRPFGMAVRGPRRRVLVIPGATIERVAAALEADGRIARGYLGLGLRPVEIEGGEGVGLIVISVDPKGPGAAAGIHQGDVIVAWNGEPTTHLQGVLRNLGPGSVGRTVTLGLRRAGEARQVPLAITERPAA